MSGSRSEERGSPPAGRPNHAAHAAPAFDSADRCARCRYDLLGLGDDRACPECGTLVGASRTGLLLLDAGPGFRARVAGGLTLLAASFIADGVVFGCGGIAAAAAVGTDAADAGPTQTAAIAAAAALSIPRTLAWWMCTHPEPRRHQREPIARLGLAVRATAIMHALLATAALVAIAIDAAITPLRLPPPLAIIAAGAALWIANWVLGWLYLRGTARRLGADARASAARRLALAPFLIVGGYPLLLLLAPLTVLIDPIFGFVPTMYMASVTIGVPAAVGVVIALAARNARRLAKDLQPLSEHGP